jgi:hypothetical protein
MGKHVQTSVLSDYSKYPSFGVATGTANTYSITLSPAPTAYSNGFGVTVVIPADSSGASTLNVNGLGPIPLKKANGNDITNLKANGVYTFRYNATTGNFIVQGEGGSGNATAADIVAGKTASTDVGDIIGTATVNSLGGKNYAIGTVTSSATAGGNVKKYNDTLSGYTLWAISTNGLAFNPKSLIVFDSVGRVCFSGSLDGVKTSTYWSCDIGTLSNDFALTNTVVADTNYIGGNGFSVFVQNPSTTYTWIAFG